MKNRTIVLFLAGLGSLLGAGCAETRGHTCAPPPPGSTAPCTCNVEGAPSRGRATVGKALWLPPATLPATQGPPVALADRLHAAPLTVITFFAHHCPCQRAHDERLARYFAAFAPRGVAFYAVDAEADSSLDLDAREAQARGYPFPILSDPAGLVADAVGARYATETLVVDRAGTLHFRGGIDSDQDRARDGASEWLRDAVAALLDGREPPEPNPKSFGCSLRRR